MQNYFPERLLCRLAELGELTTNPARHSMRKEDMLAHLGDTDVVMTHWGSAKFDKDLLLHAPNLKIIAHCAGTVAPIASEEAYARGITVLSANAVMSRYVAEWVLGAMLASLRDFPVFDTMMRNGEWRQENARTKSLFDVEIGLIGLGTVGRELLKLLKPFGCRIKIYDPYIHDAFEQNIRLCSFEEALHADIVSVHASQTPETYHLLNAEAISRIPDGATLINSARGSIVDTEALIAELQNGRIRAALDVFETEHCPQDARLLHCTQNLILQPHTAALPAGSRMTEAIIEDLERYAKGEKMQMTVSLEAFRRMTQE